jgi:hypothetical protein
VMRAVTDRAHGQRLRALVVLLWRAGLRLSEALALQESGESWRSGRCCASSTDRPSRDAPGRRRGCRTKPSAKSYAAVAVMCLGAGERTDAGLSVTNRAIELQLFGTHPLERLQRDRRGFVRQPPSKGGT